MTPIWLHRMAVWSVITLLVMLVILLWRWRRWRWWPSWLTPRKGTSDVGERPHRLDGYLAPPIQHLVRWWLVANAMWLLFYGFMLTDVGTSHGHHTVENLFTNLTTFALIFFYFNLSAFSRTSMRQPHYMRSGLVGWAFLGSAISIYELLWVSQQPPAAAKPPIPFSLIYGLGQAIALFLVAGRLDSATISDHLRAHDPRGSWCGPRTRHRAGVIVCYFYAAIQPLYPLFERDDRIVPGLVAIALGCKVYLAIWIDTLLRPAGAGLSAIQSHLYEVARFATEEVSSFERIFLRTHMNAVYRHRFQERRIGYLGVEYSYLSEFKRECLGLDAARGGLWVYHVYAKSSAMKEGVRPNDYITHINGMPLGHHNRLSQVLKGLPASRTVDVRLWRKSDPTRREAPIEYVQHTMRVRLEKYDRLIKPRPPKRSHAALDMTFLANDLDHGAVCLRGDGKLLRIQGLTSSWTGRHFETPDVGMLRFVLRQLIPGETVTVHEPAGTTDVPLRMRYDLWVRDSDPGPEERYSPARADRLSSLKLMDPVLRTRLVRCYPDRFGQDLFDLSPLRAARMAPDSLVKVLPLDALSSAGPRTWMFFDAGFGNLFEYHVPSGGPHDARILPIWGAVHSGRIHAFVTADAPTSSGVYPRGIFLSFEHDRKEFLQPGT